jgi:phosphotransferase system  glucose/maltose/N-acetylglucosamine-specific IIC component
MILTFVLSAVLLGLANLEGSEPMSEQGLVGWMQVLLALVLGPLPAYFGVWFGLKAHRLGEGVGAIAATVVNGLVIAGIWLLIVVTTVNQL